MGKRTKPTDRTADSQPAHTPFNNPFGELGRLVPTPAPDTAAHKDGAAAAAPDRTPQLEDGESKEREAWTVGGKVVLRRERKGHGGKTATILTGMLLRGIEPAAFARALGKALGCGARLDGERVVLAGDQRGRAAELLRGRGARQVVVT